MLPDSRRSLFSAGFCSGARGKVVLLAGSSVCVRGAAGACRERWYPRYRPELPTLHGSGGKVKSDPRRLSGEGMVSSKCSFKSLPN